MTGDPTPRPPNGPWVFDGPLQGLPTGPVAAAPLDGPPQAGLDGSTDVPLAPAGPRAGGSPEGRADGFASAVSDVPLASGGSPEACADGFADAGQHVSLAPDGPPDARSGGGFGACAGGSPEGRADGFASAGSDVPLVTGGSTEALSGGRLGALAGGGPGAVSVTKIPEAVLFDRDGTLVVDVPYNGDPARVELMPSAREAVAAVRSLGIPVGVVSNQSGVGRGILTRRQVTAVQQRMEALLGPFAVWAVCPHGPDDGCRCRKPLPGLVLAACERLGAAAARTVVIGDIGSDVAAARAAGARGVLVPTSITRPEEIAAADETAADLLDAVRLVLSPDAGEDRSRSGSPDHGDAVSPGAAHRDDAAGRTAGGPR